MHRKFLDGIQLLVSNLPLFSQIVLTIWLPGALVLAVLRFYILPETTGGDEFQLFVQEIRVSNFIELAFGPLYTGAILHAASRWRQGLETTYGESMAIGLKQWGKLFGTRLVAGLMIFLGTLAFVIPGIILALRFALIDPIVVLDGLTGTSARKLSVTYTQGKRWTILWTILLTFIGVFIVILLASFVLYLPLTVVGQDDNFVVAVLLECLSSILFVLPVLVLFAFYCDAKNQHLSAQESDL